MALVRAAFLALLVSRVRSWGLHGRSKFDNGFTDASLGLGREVTETEVASVPGARRGPLPEPYPGPPPFFRDELWKLQPLPVRVVLAGRRVCDRATNLRAWRLFAVDLRDWTGASLWKHQVALSQLVELFECFCVSADQLVVLPPSPRFVSPCHKPPELGFCGGSPQNCQRAPDR